jgi:hypothetical protein
MLTILFHEEGDDAHSSSTTGMKGIFGGGVTDPLLRNAKGFAIWVVE